jgi:hypothetical protein
MAAAKKVKKEEPVFLEIVKMNEFQDKVMRSVAWLLGLGKEKVYVITLSEKEL